jgi:hypothetical protein
MTSQRDTIAPTTSHEALLAAEKQHHLAEFRPSISTVRTSTIAAYFGRRFACGRASNVTGG